MNNADPAQQSTRTEGHEPRLVLEVLGDVLGSLDYLGACAHCGRQFMSRNMRVHAPRFAPLFCERCKPAAVAWLLAHPSILAHNVGAHHVM